MASVGNWVVGVSLKFKSNVGSEIRDINKALKDLREGEIARTQKAFVKLGDQMLTLGKKMDSEGNIQRNVFNSLSKGLNRVTDQTKIATDAVDQYANAFKNVAAASQNVNSQRIRFSTSGSGGYQGTSKGTSRGYSQNAPSLISSIMGQNLNIGTGVAQTPNRSMWQRVFGGAGMAKGTGSLLAGAIAPNMIGGMDPMMIGMYIGQGIRDAFKTGSAFQDAILSTTSIMGASRSQQESMYNAVMESANKTGMGPVETMNIMKDIGRLTTGTMSVDQSVGMLDSVAKFAKILQVTRHMDPTKSSDAAIEIMHLLRDYNPKDTANMMNKVLGMSELMPQDLDKTITQLKQFAPTLKNMGVPDSEALGLMVFMARAGLGTGRGGTAAREALLAGLKPVSITSYLQAQKNAQEKEIFGPGGGASFYNTKSQAFDEIGYLTAVAKWAKNNHKTKPEIAVELTNVFGRQGGTLAQLIADPKGDMYKIFKDTNDAMNRSSLSVQEMFNSLTRYDFNTQSGRLGSAWQSLQVEVTERLLPSIASIMGSMADALHDFQTYLHRNPGFINTVQKGLKAFGKGLADFTGFIEHNPGTMEMIGRFFEGFVILSGIRLAGSIGVLLANVTGISKFFSMLNSITGLFKMSTFAFLLTNPLGIAITLAITALGIAAVMFPKQLHALGDGIVSALEHFFKGLTNAYQDFSKNPQKAALSGYKQGINWFYNHLGPGLIPSLRANDTTPSIHSSGSNSRYHGNKVHSMPGHTQQTAKIEIHFHAPVYGMPDFKKQVASVMEEINKNPLSTLGNNLNNTSRTHPNIPQFMSVQTA